MPDPHLNVIHVIQGQFAISADPGDTMTTVLGSCIAACLHDPIARLGGMNHFLLPGTDPGATKNVKYGAHSMEQLINAMLRAGAQKSRIEAHVFGGGNVVKGLSRIGDGNSVFAVDFIRSEGFALRTNDTGGSSGRRLRFHPTSGKSEVRLLQDSVASLQKTEIVRQPKPASTGEVELF